VASVLVLAASGLVYFPAARASEEHGPVTPVLLLSRRVRTWPPASLRTSGRRRRAAGRSAAVGTFFPTESFGWPGGALSAERPSARRRRVGRPAGHRTARGRRAVPDARDLVAGATGRTHTPLPL